LKTELTLAVNQQIANWSVLYIKLHNYHWYVTGPEFFTLHAKFEELYNETALHIDELAERLLSLGDKPVATMRECLEVSSVKEATGGESATDMVASIVEDFSVMIAELKKGMEIAGSVGDETTGDLLLSIHSSLEKHVWMLNSFLGR
jgi:starvation-inducible DNA-binding protein